MLDAARFEEIKATGNLPSPRGVALEIIRLTQTDSVTLVQLARAIQSDPALTGRLLKASNSPVLGVRRPIASIQDAVTLLGLPMVRQLALGFSLVSQYRSAPKKTATAMPQETPDTPFEYESYWQDALLTAVAAQTIAAQMHIANPEELFVLGLLSQVGRLALATLYDARYGAIIQKTLNAPPAVLEQAELDAFAVTHGELTGALLMDWGIPRVLWLAVAGHEDPEHSSLAPDSREKRMSVALNLAWKLALMLRGAEAQTTEGLRQQSMSLIFDAAKIGIDANHLNLLVDEILGHWKQWAEILDISTYAPPAVFAPALPESETALAVPAPVETRSTVAAGAQSAAQKPGAISLRVLLVDDDPSMVLVVQKLLSQAGHIVAIARNGQEALELAFKFRPDMLVTDWMMPKMDGLQLVKALRETKIGQGVYVLFLTSLEQEDKLVEAFDAGIDDYVVKPFMPRVLAARVRAGERFVQQRKMMAQDLEEIRRFAAELAVNNRKLQQAVLTDPLTGLPNRRYAMDRLQQELSTARRRNGVMSLIMVDVDHFKCINDSHGHDVGDEVLRHVSALLRAKARLQDAICRVGGEEFLIICPDTGPEDAARCCERLRSTLADTPFARDGLKISVTASLGVVTADATAVPAELVKAADRAVYRAKAEGRNRVVVASM